MPTLEVITHRLTTKNMIGFAKDLTANKRK